MNQTETNPVENVNPTDRMIRSASPITILVSVALMVIPFLVTVPESSPFYETASKLFTPFNQFVVPSIALMVALVIGGIPTWREMIAALAAAAVGTSVSFGLVLTGSGLIVLAGIFIFAVPASAIVYSRLASTKRQE